MGKIVFERVKEYFTDRNLVIATILLFAFFFVQAIIRGLFRTNGNDLTIYLYNADIFFGGGNPYGIDAGLLYPLFVPFIIQPLNWVPAWLAHALWYFLAAYSLVVVSCIAQERMSGTALKVSAFAIAIALTTEIIQNNLLNAQINILVMSSLLCFMFFLKEEKENMAAFFLAAAISMKLTPVFFGLFLLYNRKFLLGIKTIAFVFLLTVLLPLAVKGSIVFEYYNVYYSVIMERLSGTVHGGETKLYQAIISMVAGIIILGILQSMINIKTKGVSYRSLYLYFFLPLLFMPTMLERHHMVWLFPPLMAIAHDLLSEEKCGAWKKIVAFCFLVFFLGDQLARIKSIRYWVYFSEIFITFILTIPWVLKERAEMQVRAVRNNGV